MKPTLEEAKSGYGQIATNDVQRQSNRDALQASLKGLGTESTVKNGSVVPIISSSAGKTTLDNAVKDQQNDIVKSTPPATPTDEKSKETKAPVRNKALENIDGITAEEANATGVDLTGYTPVPGTNYFIPKNGKEVSDVNAKYDAQEQEVYDTFSSFEKSLDIPTQNLIKSYKDTFAQRIDEEKKVTEDAVRSANTVNMRLGFSRYAPGQAQRILSSVERAGLDRIRKIGIEENQLIAEAEQNLVDKKYDIFLKKRGELKDIRKERVDQLNKIQEAGQKEFEYKRELIQKEKDELSKSINTIMIDAQKNGATPEVINAISNATSVSEAVQAAGEYLQGGTGIIGEYNFYKKDAIAKGLSPLSFDEYQTRDANRKVSLAKASISGLPNNVVTQIDKLSSSFDSSPIVKQYNEVVNKAETINNIVDSGINGGASDLALVFEFMKSLDPTSVVREAEYDTASKAGNPFKRVAAKMGGYIDKGQIIPQEVRDEFKRLAGVKLGVIQKQYDNLESETARKINMKTGSADGSDYLTNYRINTGKEIVDEQTQAKNKIIQFGLTNPQEQAKIKSLLTEPQPETGQPYTYEDILQIYNI